MTIRIDWNPTPHLGPVPVNWYGIGFALAFVVGWILVRRWAPKSDIDRMHVDALIAWIAAGTVIGARLYYVAQNDLAEYVAHPWRILAVWEGGLAFFGGLLGAILAAYIYIRHHHLPFLRTADLFAPAIPIGGAIGRISCGLDGMDYGTPTTAPWGVVYDNPNGFAPIDGVRRHPDQFYELVGDLIIAGILLRLRGKLPDGALFLLYLVLFSGLRFIVFFARGNAPEVLLGMKNAQWTALAILAVCIPVLVTRLRRKQRVSLV
jgi:phosphatidylglycerol:prolipoprotein diacylglycerol transferase